jgi:multiple sugar transport system permease protein
MLMTIWRDVGFYMVIYLAGLQTIPRMYYEAASIDGAGAWQSFRNVTVPLLNATIVLSTVIGVINGLQVFTSVYVMTGGGSALPGGPLNSTRTVVLHIIESAFRSRSMGYASAAAFILFLLIMAFALVQIRLTERNVEQ